MSNNNVLDEYLVRLGFEPDKVGYARFVGALRDAESQVNNRYWSMVKKVGEFEAATLGAFAAIGVGTLGFMDRVAMADQSYRLFALRMYTSLPVARELKVALDALGQPLENVMWDPELAERFHQLVKDQQIMAEQLGPTFEQNMRGIRDARFELTRFGVELQYLGMNVVNDLFKAFGKGGDDLMANLQHFNAWFIANIPYFAYWITSKLKPALVDIGQAFKAIWDEVKNVNLDTVATDVQALVKALAQASELMTHLVAAAVDLGEGKFKDAMNELKAAAPTLTAGSGTAVGAAAGFALGGAPGAVVGGLVGRMAGSAGITGAQMRSFAEPFAEDLSKKTGIPAELFMEQFGYETGGFQHFAGKFNLAGIKDPKTGKFMDFNSLQDFENHFFPIVGSYLHRWNAGPPQKAHDYAAMFESGPIKYAPDRTAAQYEAGMAHYGDIHVTVNAKTDASAEEIARKIDQVLQESLRRPPQSDSLQIQRNINEFQVPGWSYGGG